MFVGCDDFVSAFSYYYQRSATFSDLGSECGVAIVDKGTTKKWTDQIISPFFFISHSFDAQQHFTSNLSRKFSLCLCTLLSQ
jgi:hypothetical protein